MKYKLPFKNYKWLWLHKQPTEGILKPSVLFGVLSACKKYEGHDKASPQFRNELKKVRIETGTKIRLERTGKRNILRNSQQIWTSLFLLGKERQKIKLTKIGRDVISGKLSRKDYAKIVIQNTKLPNDLYVSKKGNWREDWEKQKLEIRPLLLITQVFSEIGKLQKTRLPFLTLEEVQKIIVPLSGLKKDAKYIAKEILFVRNKKRLFSDFPKWARLGNDLRIIKSFLYFLAYFHIIKQNENSNKGHLIYEMPLYRGRKTITKQASKIFLQEAEFGFNEKDADNSIDIQKRSKSKRYITNRNSPRFRRLAMRAYNGKCLITRESLPLVLEAAHIKPVEDEGPDSYINSILLRKDIHLLFDNNLIKIRTTGHLIKSRSLLKSSYKKNLPLRVKIPFKNRKFFSWREKYYWKISS